MATGLWLRPLVYSRQQGWGAVLNEARAVRRSVGITDVSTLGKIDVQGADAARFLDFIYANSFSTLAVGRARYGIMLREDGMLLDDGTTSRLAPEHFLVTTTTANAAATLEHMEFHLQALCPRLDALLTDVGDQWAQLDPSRFELPVATHAYREESLVIPHEVLLTDWDELSTLVATTASIQEDAVESGSSA